MRTVPLSGRIAAGRVAFVDDGDYDLVMQHQWHVRESVRPNGSRRGPYAATMIWRDGRRTSLYMHNLIMGHKGIDHANHDGLDNQRSNLRPATQSQNTGNARKRTKEASSAYKGVYWSAPHRKWAAGVRFKNKLYSLGLYASEVTAARAYDAKAAELFGEFACLNFPGEPPVAPPRDPYYAHAPYRQLTATLRDKITSGATSGRLPAERELAAEYGLAKMTVRKALAILRDEGLIVTRQGAHTEVAPRPGN